MSESCPVAGRVSAETRQRLDEQFHNSSYPTMCQFVGAILELYAQDPEAFNAVTSFRTHESKVVNDNGGR